LLLNTSLLLEVFLGKAYGGAPSLMLGCPELTQLCPATARGAGGAEPSSVTGRAEGVSIHGDLPKMSGGGPGQGSRG